MANQKSSPKVRIDEREISDMSNEAETSLIADRCGYCSKTKRADREAMCPEKPHLCQCPNASDSTDPNIRLGTVPSSAFRRSPSPRSSLVQPVDQLGPAAETGKVEIISIREKHGYFRKAIPHMPLPLAVFLCLLNVLIPGLGTFFSTFTVFCGCTTEHGEKRSSVPYNLLAALLQILTAPIIVGWVWSVLWGITFVNISVAKDVDEANSSSML